MFSLMGKCFSCLKRKTQPRREITLAILGLDNAGKTTATKALLGESLEVAPTVGFVNERLVLDQFEIKIFDLGGGKKIRNIWTKYFTEVYGIVYVVDASAPDRIQEAKETLQEALQNEKVAGKPILLLANKQDQPNAMDEVDICERINLENLVNTNKCPCRIDSEDNDFNKSPFCIETCSAIKGTGKKMDKNIQVGLKWICATLDHNWGVYQPRVERDMEEEAARKQKELEEKRERVRKIREEREKKEEEERMRLGIEKPASEDEDELDGDPFKRVDINKLNEKEKRMKEEKKRKKEMEMKMLGQDTKRTEGRQDDEESDGGEIRSSRSLKYLGLHNKWNGDSGLYNGNAATMNNNMHDSENDSGEEILTRKSRRATPRLPPLQKPLGTKFSPDEQPPKKKKKKKKLKTLQENAEIEEHHEVHDDAYANSKHSVQSVSTIEVKSRDSDSHPEVYDQNYLYNANIKPNKHIVVGKTLQLDDTEEELTPRQKSKKKKKGKTKRTHQSFDEFPTTPRSGDAEEYSSHLDSPTNGIQEENPTQVRKLKKKAYLKKNNRTAPSDEEIDMAETLRESSIRDMKWTLASPKKENRVLSSDDEPVITRNWGFAEDLGDTIDNSKRRIGLRPNFDDDNDML